MTILTKKVSMILPFIVMIALAISCVGNPSVKRDRLPSSTTDQTGNNGNNSGNGGGNGSTNPDNPDVDTGTGGTDTSKASVELRFFIDPFTGSAQTKLTLPKNFVGTLYLAGNNITSLQDGFVDVNFKFGLNSSTYTARAIISKAKNGGIIPQTNTDVVVLNFTEPPFQNLALPYDLFDYNEYGVDETPVQDPRNLGLYCRGLRLEHDPTFARNSVTGCTLGDDECLYAYAKINDSGFYQKNSGGVFLPIDPTNPQINLSKDAYNAQAFSLTKTMCLPDSGSDAALKMVLGSSVSDKNFSYGGAFTVGTSEYQYMGPYYASSTNLWQIKDAAVIGNKGVFKASLNALDVQSGIRSNLFPLTTKRPLKAGIEYYGSDNYEDLLRSITSLSTAGSSAWMDGCNARVSSRDSYSGEGLSSCNVVATIELVVSRNNGTDGAVTKEVVATSKDLKLQIIRPSNTDYQGNETVINSFKTCNSSSACGAGECCYNKRCWSKTIVYQCVEETNGTMSGANGATCESDYECQSLCCNSSTKKCQEHNPDFSTPLYCSKPAGSTCVAKDWCEQVEVDVCKVYQIRQDETGTPVCGVVCLPEKRFGDCIGGTCQVPSTPAPEKLSEIDCAQAPKLP